MSLPPTFDALIVQLERAGWIIESEWYPVEQIVRYIGRHPETHTRFAARISTRRSRILDSYVWRCAKGGDGTSGVIIETGATINGLRHEVQR